MKIFKINSRDTFYLGGVKYEYEFFLEDKKYFLENFLALDTKNQNFEENLKKIFYHILKPQNPGIVIKKEDLLGLTKYFIAKFLS